MSEKIDEERKKEANTCMAIGAGVGVMGIAGTALLGATCPICYIAAPALVGAGLIAKKRVSKNLAVEEKQEE